MKKRNINILLILVMFLFCSGISIGYSALSSALKVTGDLSFVRAADVRITAAKQSAVTNNGKQTTAVTYNYKSINGKISLPQLNSTVTLQVTVKNNTSSNKTVSEFVNTTFSNSNITYTYTDYNPGGKIAANGSVTVKLTFKYASSVTTLPTDQTLNYKITFNYDNYTATRLMKNDYSSYSNLLGVYNYLNGPIKSNKIESISYTNTNVVPENAIGSWDVSETQNEKVMAWYFDSDSDELYEVVIGSVDQKVLGPTDMSFMYYSMTKLTSLDTSKLLTTGATRMEKTFYACSSLPSINISTFDTSKVTTFYEMFYNCYDATTINVSSFNTAKATTMYGMFSYCGSVTTLNLTNFNTASVVSMERMFLVCKSLTSLTVTSFNTAKVENMAQMFQECEALTSLNLSSFNTAKVNTMQKMFQGMGALTSLNISNFNTSNVTNMEKMFSHITIIVAVDDAPKLTSLNLSHFNTSKVTNMDEMFSGMNKLTTLNISNFDTSNLTSLDKMFENCSALTSLNLSSFNTSNVTSMESTFSGCSSLTSINVSSFNTSNVTTMQAMFKNCKKLNSLSVTNFNTEKVKNTKEMFYGFTGGNLRTLDLSTFELKKVTNFSSMFESSLTVKSGTTTLRGIETIKLNSSSYGTLLVTTSYMFKLQSDTTFVGPIKVITKDATAQKWMQKRLDNDLGSGVGTATIAS